jgi:hypothetical protein
MIIQLLAAPVAVMLVAAGASDGVPHFDVTPSCKGAVEAGYIAPEKTRLQNCLDSEQRTRDELGKTWTTFPAADRTFCVSSIVHFSPTYTELATCLEMKRALATTKRPIEDSPTMAPAGTRRQTPPAR